jgi:type IV pilus assembly protein PilA
MNKPRDGRRDAGFTLIELLVVIIIIGILAAIAVPVFLKQRDKANNASALSDLRDLAGFEEIYLNDAERYGTIAEVQATEPILKVSRGVTLSVVYYNADKGYCLSAENDKTSTMYYYDSLAGGVQPTGSSGCPTPLPAGATPGDTITG